MHSTICVSPLRTLKMEDVEDFQVPFAETLKRKNERKNERKKREKREKMEKLDEEINEKIKNVLKQLQGRIIKITELIQKTQRIRAKQAKTVAAHHLGHLIKEYRKVRKSLPNFTKKTKQQPKKHKILSDWAKTLQFGEAIVKTVLGGKLYAGVDLKF